MTKINRDNLDLPRSAFLTGKFLDYFTYKFQRGDESARKVFEEFLNEMKFPVETSFLPFSQGSDFMLAYGILVLPLGLWEDEKSDLADALNNHFQFESRKEFNVTIGEENLSSFDFLTKLRHAIAHSNILVDIDKSKYEFWSIQGKKEVFHTRVSASGFRHLLHELGSFIYVKHYAKAAV